ncbi:sugar-binding protein [Paenibacillus swuensis]|uniref:sugar-binding protein n=1 Tax=Paenibacillus swuensis TaxID=1178515 RepID=UPI0008387C91|nr:sugar-binding protein [Paenibacillus swuensis]
MRRYRYYISMFTLVLAMIGVTFPPTNNLASAATTVTQSHTFETADPNFGKFAVGADINPIPTMVGTETSFVRKIVADPSGNRAMEITVPAAAQGKTRFYYGANSGVQLTGNRFSFEGSITFSNQDKEFDLKVIPGDWLQNLPIAKFLPTGDIQVKSGTISQTIWAKRGNWTAGTAYKVKLDLYKDINKYDLFLTDTATGITNMLASGEPLMNYNNHKFLESGIAYYNIEAVGTAAATATSIRYDDVRISYSNDKRDSYMPAADVRVLRTTTFETTDSDSIIAGTATGSVIKSNLLDAASPSTMKIVEQNGSRWVEVTTNKDQAGDIGFPVYPSWASDASTRYNSYTLEADLTLKDRNADYELNSINGTWGDSRSGMVLISKNGNIYARSSNNISGSMAARTTWDVDQPFSLKLVLHTDSKSYDLYHERNGVSTKLVHSEPLRNIDYTSGIAAFMLTIKKGVHAESTVLVDNIRVSASNLPGTAPVIHASPGELFHTGVSIGEPVNYYVSPYGNDDNPGKSLNAPFRSLQKAADLSAPGDTIYLMDGTWTYTGGGRMLSITKSGAIHPETNEPAYITYKAAPGAHPVLFAQTGWDAIMIQANYIKIDGIEVKGNNQSLTVEDGNQAYNYYVDSVKSGSPVNYGDVRFTNTNTNGISIDSRSAVEKGLNPFHHIIISNNVIHDMPGAGVNALAADYVTIDNNHIYNNCWYTIYATSGISVLGGVDIDVNTGYKSIVRNNKVHDNQTNVKWGAVQNYSDGNGIIIDYNKNTGKSYPAYKGKTLVENNISYNNGGSGIHSFNSANVDIINNTLYNNNLNPYLSYAQLFASRSDNINIFNNIVYARDLRPGEANYKLNSSSGSEFVIYANNLYYNGMPGVIGINDVIADPKFLSLNPLSADFLKLHSNSPAIDRGTQTLAPSEDYNKASRPKGTKFDIGAYESSYTNENPIGNDIIDIEAVRKSMIFTPKSGLAYKGTPVIDGTMDRIWGTAPVIKVNQFIDNLTAPVTSGATASTRILWDENYLYVFTEVTDPLLSKLNVIPYQQDSVEVFLDENNAKTTSHEKDDRQYRINFENEKSIGSQGNVSEFISQTAITSTGYIVEVKIPFKTIEGAEGKVIGFDSQVNDDNGVGSRTSTAIWSDPKGAGYSNTSRWGNVTLRNQTDLDAPITKLISSPLAPDGLNGWYVQPVTVTLNATDTGSGVEKTVYSVDGGLNWLPYLTPVSYQEDGKHTLFYKSVDKAGNAETTQSALIHIDQTAPNISVTGIVYGTLLNSEDVFPIIRMKDNYSGVDASMTSAYLDAVAYDVGHGIELYSLNLGNHTLVVNATDLAGNAQLTKVTFQTYASITSLQSLINRFEANHWIDNKGIANSLRMKLTHGQFTGFMEEVRAQKGKHIFSEAADYLLRDASYVMNQTHIE